MTDTVRKATSVLLLSLFLLPYLMNDWAASAVTVMAGKGPWCVAKPQITREALQANIDYVCGFAGWVCDKIQKGAPCYSTSIIRQASYAMNAYFFVFGPKGIDCDFNGTARIVHVDPSYKNCEYPS